MQRLLKGTRERNRISKCRKNSVLLGDAKSERERGGEKERFREYCHTLTLWKLEPLLAIHPPR